MRSASRPQFASTTPHAESRLDWQRVFLLLTAVLSSTIVLKIGQVQYLELLYAVQLLLLLLAFARQRFETTIFRSMLVLGGMYAAFAGLALLLAGVSLRQDFYLPPKISVLKLPFVLALLRATELVASVGITLYLVHLFARSPAKLRLVMRVYFWAGVASALYSLLTLPLALLKIIDLGVYGYDLRWRGFFNEGGPYGLYLVSVLLVAMALRALGWERRRRLWLSLFFVCVALVGSRSKAAAIAFFLLLAVNALLLQSGRRRVVTAVVFVVVVGGLSAAIDLQAALRLYQVSGEAYERLSRRHVGDVNFVEGRIAGMFIVPRMITEHPLLGVGWGNYGVVRNAPEYRGASAWADLADDPGLGVFGQAAEFGIPLTLLLLVCLFYPVVYLRRLRAPSYVLNLALLQPFVHLFGAQLNLTYPWVTTAMALGLGIAAQRQRSEPVRLPAPALVLPPSPQPAGAH